MKEDASVLVNSLKSDLLSWISTYPHWHLRNLCNFAENMQDEMDTLIIVLLA